MTNGYRNEWRTLGAGGLVKTFATEEATRSHAAGVVKRTKKWCGIEHWSKDHPQDELNRGWALVDVVKPTLLVKVENSYEDGHESTHQAKVVVPDSITEDDIETWWEDVVLNETGDGHGIGNDLGYCYTVTVLEAPEPFAFLVGTEREWSGK
jgi:hypothetical protein